MGAITVLARAHRNLIGERTRHANVLASRLREYYPQALETFDKLADRDTLAVLARVPIRPPVPDSRKLRYARR